MNPKDKILVHAFAILVVAASVLVATNAAEARVFDWLGWQYGWDMCWWH